MQIFLSINTCRPQLSKEVKQTTGESNKPNREKTDAIRKNDNSLVEYRRYAMVMHFESVTT